MAPFLLAGFWIGALLGWRRTVLALLPATGCIVLIGAAAALISGRPVFGEVVPLLLGMQLGYVGCGVVVSIRVANVAYNSAPGISHDPDRPSSVSVRLRRR